MDESTPSFIFAIPAARKQCKQAWSELIDRFQSPLLAYVTQIIGDREEAFDIVQNTFIKAMRHLNSLKVDAKFANWLFRIARQQSIDHFRRIGSRSKLQAILANDITEHSEAPSAHVLRSDDARLAMHFIQSLEQDLREPIVLHYLEDFALSDIAEITGVPRGTVKSRLHRARIILRKQMEESHELTR